MRSWGARTAHAQQRPGQHQQRGEPEPRSEGDERDRHCAALAAARLRGRARRVDDLELDPADLEQCGRELRTFLTATKVAQAREREVDVQAQLRLDVLIDVAQRRRVGAVEVIERLPCVNGLLLGEIELALVQQIQRGR